jgi:hypothetical protein
MSLCGVFVSRVDTTYPLAHRTSNNFAISDLLLSLILFTFQLLFPCGNYTRKQSLIFPLKFIYGFGRLNCALPTVQNLWKSEKK